MNGPDRDFDAALDRLAVPSPRVGLIDDIVAAAQSRAEPAPQVWGRAPRDRRGGWLRGHRVFAATMAATVLSATAAAAAGGWLGEAGSRLPVIAQIASVMPEAVKAPSVRIAHRDKQAIAASSATTAPTTASVAPAPPITVTPRQQKIVDRLETRLERREARRAAMGLPANTEKERALLDRFKAAETRAVRRGVVQEVRALRQERRAERQALPACTPDQVSNPAANGCRPKMTPERRAEIMERLCARMAENGRTPPRCRPIVKGGPEPLAYPTPQ
jgi:hypothetical protein